MRGGWRRRGTGWRGPMEGTCTAPRGAVCRNLPYETLRGHAHSARHSPYTPLRLGRPTPDTGGVPGSSTPRTRLSRRIGVDDVDKICGRGFQIISILRRSSEHTTLLDHTETTIRGFIDEDLARLVRGLHGDARLRIIIQNALGAHRSGAARVDATGAGDRAAHGTSTGWIDLCRMPALFKSTSKNTRKRLSARTRPPSSTPSRRSRSRRSTRLCSRRRPTSGSHHVEIYPEHQESVIQGGESSSLH